MCGGTQSGNVDEDRESKECKQDENKTEQPSLIYKDNTCDIGMCEGVDEDRDDKKCKLDETKNDQLPFTAGAKYELKYREY